MLNRSLLFRRKAHSSSIPPPPAPLPIYLQQVLDRAIVAAKQFGTNTSTQEAVNKIVSTASSNGCENKIQLARMAVEETTRGLFEDKVFKNQFACEYVVNSLTNVKTVGVLEKDHAFGFTKIAEPIGVILALTPVTNPTSTVLYKSLMALKTRNAIIIAPHPSAAKCSKAAADIIYQAAVSAGAPENCIQTLQNVSRAEVELFMQNPNIALTWATGGAAMVQAAMKSGRPSITGGAGNCPAVVDETADLQEAASQILLSKAFDNGLLCAAENSVVVVGDENRYQAFKDEVTLRGGVILTSAQSEAMRTIILGSDGLVNIQIVGKTACDIAKMAGFTVPPETRALLAEVDKVGPAEPWSHEKLSPLLALYKSDSIESATSTAVQLLSYGGLGHTSVLYTTDESRISAFSLACPATRVLINCPSSQGAIGELYNFRLKPTLTIGCGKYGSGSLTTEISPLNFLSIKVVVERRDHHLWFKSPQNIYFAANCMPPSLREEIRIFNIKRVFIVSDRGCQEAKIVDRVVDMLKAIPSIVDFQVFSTVESDPSFNTVKAGAKELMLFKPDCIVAVGGGSPMDAAKIMRMLVENPQFIADDFSSVISHFTDINSALLRLDPRVPRSRLICIPTTSGTGSEVNPFAVISSINGQKNQLASYSFTPDTAIVDSELTATQPKALAINSGLDALSHAIESLVSILASEFTKPYSLHATKILLAPIGKGGLRDAVQTSNQITLHESNVAKKNVHRAATIAGLAFANSFLGIGHSLAHALGSYFQLPHGLCCALVLPYVVRYNSASNPTKLSMFPNIHSPIAGDAYSEVVNGGSVNDLIEQIQELRKDLGTPMSIRDALIHHGGYSSFNHSDFDKLIDEMCLKAFVDPCTASNPRLPMVSELKIILKKAWEGEKP
jgi:acetaldehyde dehydrogenase/alcohol dehydrogenase